MNVNDINSLTTVILVTVMVAVMVLMLPWLDRKISSRLGLNLHGGLSANPDADRLLRVRQYILNEFLIVDVNVDIVDSLHTTIVDLADVFQNYFCH